MDFEKVDNMVQSILKNIGELSEQCISSGITNAYDLMDIIYNYDKIINYLKEQNESPNLKGIHDTLLTIDLGVENEK